MEVYIEPVEPAPRLYVIGAGHVGLHLARLAKATGFRTYVLDDREKFATASAFRTPTKSWWTTSPTGCTAPTSPPMPTPWS